MSSVLRKEKKKIKAEKVVVSLLLRLRADVDFKAHVRSISTCYLQ